MIISNRILPFMNFMITSLSGGMFPIFSLKLHSLLSESDKLEEEVEMCIKLKEERKKLLRGHRGKNVGITYSMARCGICTSCAFAIS